MQNGHETLEKWCEMCWWGPSLWNKI